MVLWRFVYCTTVLVVVVVKYAPVSGAPVRFLFLFSRLKFLSLAGGGGGATARGFHFLWRQSDVDRVRPCISDNNHSAGLPSPGKNKKRYFDDFHSIRRQQNYMYPPPKKDASRF